MSSVLSSSSSSLYSSTSSSLYTASSTTSASQVLTDTTKKMAEISQKITEYAESQASASEKAAKQAGLTVTTYEKEVTKSPYTGNGSATNIGTLVRDTSRLNVYSALETSDKADVFKFRVQSAGDAQIGVLADDGLRVQVTTRYGGIIADSAEGQGKASKNYEALQQGEYNLPAGEYYIKVTNASTTPAKDADGKTITSRNYAIQMSQGVYSKDYDTIAQQPTASDYSPQLSGAALELQTLLTSAASTDYATGESGSTKLMSAVFGS